MREGPYTICERRTGDYCGAMTPHRNGFAPDRCARCGEAFTSRAPIGYLDDVTWTEILAELEEPS